MGKESSTLFVGYVIQRHLCAQGLHCDVVAPSSIARPPGVSDRHIPATPGSAYTGHLSR